MRKHSARKWLHFVLDLLPIILIPIFMIYSHRHDPSGCSSYTEQVPIYYQTNEVSDASDLVVGNVYTYENNFTPIEDQNQYLFFNFKFLSSQYEGDEALLFMQYGNVRIFIENSGTYLVVDSIPFNFLLLSNARDIDSMPFQLLSKFSICDVNYFKEYQEITYTFENDIMGAFMNNFNYSVNNYFNMSSVFNMGDIYNWINANMFGGNAPMVISSIYNIIVYEFIMDLIFLMYSIFMFIIDFSQELLSRCFSFSRHGGSR